LVFFGLASVLATLQKNWAIFFPNHLVTLAPMDLPADDVDVSFLLLDR
jgi:hypothetical protein